MGCFSWMYADFNNTKPLLIGAPAYVITPENDSIFEASYGGYGIFGGRDIYDLVVDWNRKDIKNIIRNSTRPTIYKWSDEFLDAIMNSDEEADHYILTRYPDYGWLRKEWKRTLGIDIACYDEQNESLRFPIKITRQKCKTYSELPPSKGDEGQGFGYYGE